MGCVGNRKVLENITRSLEHNPLRTKHFPIPRTPTTTTLLFNNNKNPQKGKNNIFSVWENKWDESYEFFTFALFFCNHRYSPPITESNPTWDSHAHRKKKNTQRKCFTESLKKNDDFLFQSMWVCFLFQKWILLLGLWWVSLLFLVFCLKPSWGKVVGYLTLLLFASSSSSSTICYA